MRFQTARPVTGTLFFNRSAELALLDSLVADLQSGVNRYYAVMGQRKIGKSSLLREFKNRAASIKNVWVIIIDAFNCANDTDAFFMEYGCRLLDEFLMRSGSYKEAGVSIDAFGRDTELTYLASKLGALKKNWIDRLFREMIALKEGGPSAYRYIISLPQIIAEQEGVKLVVIFDEFQELARLNTFKKTVERIGDIFKVLRANWQEHGDVDYILSGSQTNLLRQIIEPESAPFFQQFSYISLREFDPKTAASMLNSLFGPSSIAISDDQIAKIMEVTNSHPYYIQVLGEDIQKGALKGPIDDELLNETIQSCLFQSSGRLSLYFEGHYARIVRRSASLEKVLGSISKGNYRIVDVAEDIRQKPGSVASWVKTLVGADVLKKENDNRYLFRDAVFGLWIRGSKSEHSSFIPASVVGSESEGKAAEVLARQGFSTLYQAKASRGAFDLLAMVNTIKQVGIQVKTIKKYPAYLSKAEVEKMKLMGKELGWTPIACFVMGDDTRFFKVKGRRSGARKTVKFDCDSGVEFLLEIL